MENGGTVKLHHSYIYQKGNLWFADGDIVIYDKTRCFRVYAQNLAESSSVFSDMFSFPQSLDGPPDMVEGIPAVRLWDSDADVESFVTAIFEPSFFEVSRSGTKLSAVLDILRLSSKYDSPTLFNSAVLYLEKIYPPTLESFLASEENRCRVEHTGSELEAHMSVVAAAIVYNIPWLLPALYYSISCFPRHQLHRVQETTEWDSLPPSGRHFILYNQAVRLDCRWEFRLESPKEVVKGCTQSNACSWNIYDAGAKVLRFGECDRYFDPMRFWDSDQISQVQLCDICVRDLETAVADAQHRLWNKLPGRMRLDGWWKLLKMREEMMSGSTD
ncbi:hypothetical protein C8R43DRAFT_910519 [Mycena crocata]|nr:hypothetical protein C8R43DRAFT_910519 [Mycena crocata]